MEKRVFSVDYETYYDAEYSLKKIPVWPYVYDKRFNAYLVSVAGPDGFLWVGHPSKFDWSLLNGQIVLHHNASFDALVTRRLQEEGKIPAFSPVAVHDTIDLARYLKFPAPLKDVAKFVFKLPDLAVAGKNAREKMKGVPVDRLMDDPEILKYAANDALLTLRLWDEYSELWPEPEREVSRLNREAGWRGMPVDRDYVDRCVSGLQERLFAAERSIPWEWPEGKTPLARKKIIEQAQNEVDEIRPLTEAEQVALSVSFADTNALDRYSNFELVTKTLNDLWGSAKGREYPCAIIREDGQDLLKRMMWYPSSFAQDDENCEAWEDRYGDRFAWIGAVRDWRRQNALLQKFLHLQKYVDANGIYHYGKKYHGAHPGRFSGDGRFNMENLPRKPMFCSEKYPEGTKDRKGRDVSGEDVPESGFDLRRCFVGDLLILDYEQIEARVLLALVRDEEQLELVRKGVSVYEAHAAKTMGWDGTDLKKKGETDPKLDKLYRLAKARVLGGGYGCGGPKFAKTAWTMAKLRLTDEEGIEAVKQYRADNPRVVKFWGAMDAMISKACARRLDCMTVKLPSGRIMRYWYPRERTVKKIVKDKTTGESKLVSFTGYFTMIERGASSSYRKTYGANIVENICQGAARDILVDAWRALDAHGYDVGVTVHDEFVILKKPGQSLEEAERIILDAGRNSWASFIPLGLESKESKVYTK